MGDISFAEVIEALYPAQEKVQREINPVVYRVDDFRAKLASNNTWVRVKQAEARLALGRAWLAQHDPEMG